MRYGCYANGFLYDSHHADFCFFFFTFLQAYVTCYLYGLVLG